MGVPLHIRLTVPRILLCAAFLVGVGCSTASKTVNPQSNTDEEPYQFEQEGTIPPLVPGEVNKEPDIEEMQVAPDSLDVEALEIPVDTTASMPVSEPTPMKAILGFRVQVFATNNEQSAHVERRRAADALNMTAYVEKVDGIYKVRVGDFLIREEAQAAMGRIKSSGYADAWVVSTLISPQSPPQSSNQ